MAAVEEGSNQPIISPKRIKVDDMLEVEREDRISILPDCLLIEILSRLPSTESAIRTGTLSKRWIYLWTLVPTLIFNRNPDKHTLSDFISFVDKTLSQCRQSKLKKLAVNTNLEYDIQFDSQVNNWIRYAMSCRVEELDLSLFYNDVKSEAYKAVFLLNNDFFINSCFTDMRLGGCVFHPSGAICWERLRSLYIDCGYGDEDLIEKIISGSPLLETLVMDECYGIWQLNITSRSIKKMAFSRYFDPDGEFESDVDDWIRYAIHCNVEEAELDLNFRKEDYNADFELNEDFFVGSCFTDLKLAYFKFNPEEDCYGYRRVDITSTSVKKLVYSRYDDHVGEFELPGDIEINAPNILSLTIRGYLHLLTLLLSNLSSLVEANLDISTEVLRDEITFAEEEMLRGFIQSISHVKEFKIGDYDCKDKLEKYKEATLEKYEPDRDPKFVLTGPLGNRNTDVGSIFEEMQQLAEDSRKTKLELAERKAMRDIRKAECEQLKENIQKMKLDLPERVMQEAEYEQLKERIQHIEHEQAQREANWVMREAEWDAQLDAKMIEMENKLKVIKEMLDLSFSLPHPS